MYQTQPNTANTLIISVCVCDVLLANIPTPTCLASLVSKLFAAVALLLWITLNMFVPVIDQLMMGCQDSTVVECRTCDRKFTRLSPGRSGRRMFFSRVNFSCWLLIQYRLHPCAKAAACERSQSFCQKYRWKVMWLWMKWHCKLVHGCMVYTENALRRQQFHVAPGT